MINIIEKKYNLENIFNFYKVTYNDGKISFVPLDPANKDYQDIQEYIKNGGVIIDNPPLPTEEISE